MNRVDRILDLLDNATQRTTEAAYPTDPGDPEACWRCLVQPGEGAAGVCADCRAVLLDETYAAPADDDFPWMASWRPVARGGIHYYVPGMSEIRAVERTPGAIMRELISENATLTIDGREMRVESWSLTVSDYDDSGWEDALPIEPSA